MTYEEYKKNKEPKHKKKYLSIFLNKLFTIIIFIMIVLIISNYSPKFKNFIINDVLNKSMDFSKYNKIIKKFTNRFENKNTMNVSNIIETKEEYLDGIKYIIDGTKDVYVKGSGIVTFIGKKDGYNNTIIVQQSDGYYAWYGNINESVKIYDYVEKGSIIGSANKEYYYALFKDNKKVNLNEN